MADSIRAPGQFRPAPQVQDPDKRNEKVLSAARLYESQFLREMVRAMRKTVPESEFLPVSAAEKMYREQLDDHYVDDWVGRGGVGMADLIYDQIMDRYANHAGVRAQRVQKPQGPLGPEAGKFNMKGLQQNPAAAPKENSDSQKTKPPVGASNNRSEPMTLEFKFANAAEGSSIPVLAPWAGRVVSQSVQDGRTNLILSHENGLKSALSFQGSALVIGQGQELAAGQAVGAANPGGSLLWRVQT